jgi:hypothetical protein
MPQIPILNILIFKFEIKQKILLISHVCTESPVYFPTGTVRIMNTQPRLFPSAISAISNSIGGGGGSGSGGKKVCLYFALVLVSGWK